VPASDRRGREAGTLWERAGRFVRVDGHVICYESEIMRLGGTRAVTEGSSRRIFDVKFPLRIDSEPCFVHLREEKRLLDPDYDWQEGGMKIPE
jgi:hypothetical protein